MTRSVNKTGWTEGSTSGGSLLTDLPTGLLALAGDEVVPIAPLWSGAFFTVPGLFNNPAFIQNNGAGVIQVNRTGLYMLFVYGTNRNTTITCEMNVRFLVNGATVIPNSIHQIYEHNTDNDRDMICKGVPAVLNAGDTVECQFNSNNAGTTLKGDATWFIHLATGVQGTAGAAGPASFNTEEFSVFRSLQPINQNITYGRNIFYNEGSSPGTVSCAAGSPNVVGVGTAFLADIAPGNVIDMLDDGGIYRIYKVLSVTNNTNLILAENAIGIITAKNYRNYTVQNTALYNVNNKFDVTKSIWKPSAGKHVVSACGGFGNVDDAKYAYVYLYNLTANTIIAVGGRGRNEGNGQFNSVLACEISANGTDEYCLFCISNDATVDLQGIESFKTYWMAFKFSETP